MKCVCCKSELDTDSPFLDGGFRVVNPYTLRICWMCGHCFLEAVEESKTKPSTKNEYANRYEQWMEKFLDTV